MMTSDDSKTKPPHASAPEEPPVPVKAPVSLRSLELCIPSASRLTPLWLGGAHHPPARTQPKPPGSPQKNTESPQKQAATDDGADTSADDGADTLADDGADTLAGTRRKADA
jgi:hypothetical protein